MPELDPRDARIAELEAKIAWLMERVAKLEAENVELRARLGQNSQNSSQPPSSDPPGTPRQPKDRSGRARGGQPGHKRHLRERLEPDRVVPLIPERCHRCHRKLRGRDPSPRIHQVVELPEVHPFVTDYEIHEVGCECGATTCAELPPGVPTGTFGPRLTAAVALLSGRYRMPKRTVKELLADFFGIDVALGSVSKMERFASAAVAEPVEEARLVVREQPVVHQDETGWFVEPRGGRKARAWLWVAVSAVATVFRIARSRGAQVTKEMLGEDFGGFLVGDRWSAYRWKPRGMRQICWAHLIRDFRGFVERGGQSARIGEKLLAQTVLMFGWWHRIRDGTLTRATFQRRMKKVERTVARLLRKAAVCGDTKTEGMARDILKHEPALFTFVHAAGVDPTNNAAERALRTAVIWRKTSFGTDSDHGSRFVERILTVVATLRQRRRHVLMYLTAACEARHHDRPAPSLLTAP